MTTQPPTDADLIRIAARLAQTLLEFIEAGEEGGSDMTADRALLERTLANSGERR